MTWQSEDPRLDQVRAFLAWLGDDPGREGLQNTPERFLKAWKFWTSGYDVNPNDVIKTFVDGSEQYSGLVFQGCIPVWSHCEHHLAPFFGVAHIGYIPNGCILGLSKFSRVVEIFARRLQVQERLTCEIANALNDTLEPHAVGVVLHCRHTCMESRGVEKAGTMTYTSHLLGYFREDVAARAEFMQFVQQADRPQS